MFDADTILLFRRRQSLKNLKIELVCFRDSTLPVFVCVCVRVRVGGCFRASQKNKVVSKYGQRCRIGGWDKPWRG